MNFAYLLLLLLQKVHSNLYCTSKACTSCQQGYVYKNISCISLCPSGFEISGAICNQTSKFPSLFNLEFSHFTSLLATCIDKFCHPNNFSFIDSEKLSPIPTSDKGFYFEPTSGLKSSESFVPGPEFTFGAYIRILNPGTIFSISDNEKTYFSLVAIENRYIFTFLLTHLNQSSAYFDLKVNHGNKWVIAKFISIQKDNYLYIYSASGNSYFNDYEFRQQAPNLQFIFGSLNNTGFKGFIFKSNAMNDYNSLEYNIHPLLKCVNTSPFYYGECLNCETSCNKWPICNHENCNYCYSDKCLSCTGVGPDDCNNCSDSTLEMCLNSFKCNEGIMFNCSNCIEDHILETGICILPVTLPQRLNIKFDQVSQFYGDIFQNGKNETTYAPYNNAEIDDPIPLNSRGLFFMDKKFITTKQNLTFNASFSIFLWYKTSNIWPLLTSDNFILFNGKESFISLVNSAEVKKTSLPKVCTQNSWSFIGMIVEYSNKGTNIDIVCNKESIDKISIKGFYFYSSNTSMLIYTTPGRSLYLYQLVILQYTEREFIDDVDICSKGIDFSCLSDINYNQFYHSGYRTIFNCDQSCKEGCRYWGTCNQCSDIMCKSCENFNKTCAIDSSFNPCFEGLKISIDKTSCCHPTCATCKGLLPSDCISCIENYFLRNSECLLPCPVGFTNNITHCILLSNTLINMNLNITLDNFTTTNNVRFYTGNDSLFYPQSGPYDPIPAKNRGFYFNETSYMRSDPIILPFDCIFSLWIRIIKPGIIIQKQNLLFNSQFNFKYLSNSFTIPYLNDSWQLVNFFKKYDKNLISFTIRQNLTNKVSTFAYAYEEEKESSLIIGDNAEGFTGFLWRFMITATSVPNNLLKICSLSLLTDCVDYCGINDYFNGNICIQCHDFCEYGCVRNSDCNLCSDSKCYRCGNFASGCVECVENAHFSSQCVCDDTFFWNSSTLKCERCQEGCSICENSSSCIECCDTFTYLENECKCTSNQYLIENHCYQCHELCKECTGPSENECLSCNEPLIINNSTCECPKFYYLENNSCSECMMNCETCNSFNCFKCENNLTLIEDMCKCLENQYKFENYCVECDQSCLNCFDSNYYHCSSCSKAELFGICYEKCPLGYNLINKTCLVEDINVLEFKFGPEDYSFTDQRSLITAETCENLNQLVIKTVDRGIYFDEGCLKLQKNNESLILVSPSFFIALWIRVSKYSPLLILKTNENFKIEIIRSPQGIISNVVISSTESAISFEKNLDLKIWSHLTLGLKYDYSSSNLILAVNSLTKEIKFISEKLYKDGNSSVLYIGSADGFLGLFSGFLYSFQLFTDFPSLEDILLNNCLLSPDLSCLLNCEINEFFDGSCNPCPNYCNFTCISLTKCDDCGDNCLSCNKSNKSECFLCEKGFRIENNSCEECKNGTYYNENLNMCEDCGNGCMNCNKSNKSMCFKCEKGYELIKDQCKECQNGTYYDEILEKCEICNNYCHSCNKSNKNICFECENGYELINNTCKECENGTYFNGILEKCIDCESNCINCNKTDGKACFKCKEGFSLVNFECKECISGTYYNYSLEDCENCGNNCINCDKFDKNICYKCEKGYTLKNSHCEECENGTYYNDIFQKCQSCGNNCLICNKSDKSECFDCEKGYTMINSRCEPCKERTYFNETTKNCENCEKLCEKCENIENCTKCTKNSQLINGTCVCENGYIEKKGCIKDYFYANLSISFNNEIYILFSEPLKKSLKYYSVSVEVNEETVEFEIIEVDLMHFTITIKSEFYQKSAKNYKATIIVSKNIYSVYESPLFKNSFNATLYYDMPSQVEIEIPKLYSKSTVTSAIAATSIASILFFDPATIFNLMNMIELFSYILLYDIQIHESLIGFISDLNSQMQIPNVFHLFITSSSKTPEKYSRLSYKSSLFILNAGMSLVILFFITFVYTSTSILSKSKNEKIKKIFMFLQRHIRYSIFIRFYLQTYFQILICCLICIKYTDLKNTLNIIDYSLSIALIIFQVLGLIKIIKVVRLAPRVNISEQMNFINMYSTIFYEFKSLEVSDCLFYVIFVIRRIILAILIVGVNSPILQLTISIVLCLSNFCFIITVNPFKDKLYQNFYLINELTVMSYYCYFLSTFIRYFNMPLIDQSNLAVKIILFSLGINIFYNIVKILWKLLYYIKSKYNQRLERVTPVTELPTSVFPYTEKSK